MCYIKKSNFKVKKGVLFIFSTKFSLKLIQLKCGVDKIIILLNV